MKYLLAIISIILWPCICFAEYSDGQLVNAIFKAEHSTAHPYGIMVKYRRTTPRQACFNSVRHARRRFNQQHEIKDFVYFLSLTYAPINAKNDPHGLNKNWVKNVKMFLVKGEK
jgi:hypothetical protein